MTRTTAETKLDCGCQLTVSTLLAEYAETLLAARVRDHVCGARLLARKAADRRLHEAHRDEWNRYYVDALETR